MYVKGFDNGTGCLEAVNRTLPNLFIAIVIYCYIENASLPNYFHCLNRSVSFH